MSKPKYQVRPLDCLSKKTVNPKQHTFQQNIKIFLRIKPQDNKKQLQSITILNQHEVQVIPPSYSTESQRVYHYEQVFEPEANNGKVFERTMVEPIRNVLSGFNSTIFIYGMTGAGKTHTMFNSPQSNDPGMVGSALIHLFNSIAANSHSQYQVKLSFFEIYNENIRDLLTQSKEPLTIMEDAIRGVFINELKEIEIRNENFGNQLLEEGMSRRVRQATKNNQFSSRSHAILQFNIKKITPIQGTGQASVQQSKLFMIDLAGNQKTSQNESKRFLEGVNINKSLLTLGKCINILSEKKKNTFIPYRDSKLTRILKDSLGGNSKTVMIACISSESKFYEQTLNTLKYSSKAKQIKNKGKGGQITKVNLNSLHNEPEEDPKMVTLEDESTLFAFINTLESILTDKIRTEKVQEELEHCLIDCEKEKCFQMNKQIRTTLIKIKDKHTSILSVMEEQINSFVTYMNRLKGSNNISTKKLLKQKEEQKMKQSPQIDLKKQFQSSMSKTSSQDFPHFKTQTEKELIPENNSQHIPIPVCFSQSQKLQSSKNNLLRKQKKNNPISIKIESCRNINKENIPFNGLKRCTSSSHSSIKSQNQRTFTKVLSNRPLIDIQKDDYKVQSPSIKETILKRCDSSSQKLGVREVKGGTFIQRLKQIDKIANQASSQLLHSFLDEYERQKYQLSRVEKSMLNKLRFLLKNRGGASISRPMLNNSSTDLL